MYVDTGHPNAVSPLPRHQLSAQHAHIFPQNVVPPNPRVIHSVSYTPHTAPPYSSAEHPYSQVHYQHSHARQTLSPSRRRSDQDIVYSMLTPIVPDVSHIPSSAIPMVNSGRQKEATREGPNPQHTPHPGNPIGMGPGAFGWPPSPAPNPQYLNFDAMTSPTKSPEMRLYTPSQDYNFPHAMPLLAQHVQSGPSHAAHRQVSPTSSTSSSPASRRASLDSSVHTKSCSHCHATSTPLWRREPTTLKPLCNACGLYLQQRNKHRPQELIDADAADDLSDISEGETSGPECSHCRTHHTSVWRRSKTGAQLCNACGVYSRLRGRDRPLSLKRSRIKPRTKHSPT